MIYKPIFYVLFYHRNLYFKQFIDDIAIDLKFSKNFANIEDRKRCNLMLKLSKYTFNKKILSNVVT